MKHCTQVEKLLPLYVGGDLDREAEPGVKSHLAACRSCAALAEEFVASQQWLRSYAPPAFDSDSFAASRRGVLEQSTRRGRSWVMFARSWAPIPRPAMAMLVIAILIGILIAVVTFNRDALPVSDSADLNAKHQSNDKTTPSTVPAIEEHQAAGAEGLIPTMVRQPGGKRSSHGTIQSVLKLAALVPMVLPPVSNTIDSEPGQSIAHGAGSSDAGGADTIPADTDMLRIEIQTGNPEIRIIWFTPKALDGLEKPATETSIELIQETL
jgi:anti-sigma factor RsiW